MHSNDELEALMARYQGGDVAAARALIELVSPQLYRFLAAHARTREDADDLLQETWLRIHRVRQTYRSDEPVLPWFYAIARRAWVDHYRRTLRASAREQRMSALSEDSTTLAEETESERLEELLAPLSSSQREVIELLKIGGLSIEEVARVTSSTVGAVKQKAHRAYKKIRAKISGLGLPKPQREASS